MQRLPPPLFLLVLLDRLWESLKVAWHQTLKGVCLIPVYLLMDKNFLLWHLVIQKVLLMIWKLDSWLSEDEPSQWNMRFGSQSEFKDQLIPLKLRHC